jgi:hypothetical protein
MQNKMSCREVDVFIQLATLGPNSPIPNADVFFFDEKEREVD